MIRDCSCCAWPSHPLPFWFPVASPLPSHVFTGGFCLRIVGIHFGQELLQVFVFCNIPVLAARYRTSCAKMFPRLSFSVYRTARGRSELFFFVFLETTSPARWEPPVGGPPALLSRNVVSRKKMKKINKRKNRCLDVCSKPDGKDTIGSKKLL